ncbi:Alpha/Beta hydrolase protein [Aspergillus venezuelensis]
MGVESFSEPIAVPEMAKDIPQALEIEDVQKAQQAQSQYKEEFVVMSKVDPEFAALFTDIAFSSGGFFTGAPIEHLRAQHAASEKQAYEITPTLGTKESVGKITMRDGHKNEIRIFRPSSMPEEGSPVVVLIYGGGYQLGTNLQLAPFARALSAMYGATSITISYRLAPEHPFPTGPKDVWDSVKWVAQHATLLGADPSKGFIIGGVSAGGHLTTLTAQRAVKENLQPPLTGLWVSVPVLAYVAENIPEQYREDWVSRTQNKYSPIMDVADIDAAERAYKPDLTSDNFSPFSYPELAHKLPPAYIQVAGLDPLRDDGLIYEKYLRDNGVKTRLDLYPGVPHCHFAFYPGLESSKKFRGDVPIGVGWLLGREVSEERVTKIAGDALGLIKIQVTQLE